MPISQLVADMGGLVDRGPGRAGAIAVVVGTAAAPARQRTLSPVRHLQMLEEAGLLSPGRAASALRAAADRLEDVLAWIRRSRRFWERRIDRLDDHLRELQKQKSPNGDGDAGRKGGSDDA